MYLFLNKSKKKAVLYLYTPFRIVRVSVTYFDKHCVQITSLFILLRKCISLVQLFILFSELCAPYCYMRNNEG